MSKESFCITIAWYKGVYLYKNISKKEYAYNNNTIRLLERLSRNILIRGIFICHILHLLMEVQI